MSTATRRRRDELADMDERLRLIRDATAVIDEQHLDAAIATGERGDLLRLVLDNIRRLAA